MRGAIRNQNIKRKQNHLIINVAIQKIIHRATSPPEKDSSTSEECQHFQVWQIPWHCCYCDRPVKQRSDIFFNAEQLFNFIFRKAIVNFSVFFSVKTCIGHSILHCSCSLGPRHLTIDTPRVSARQEFDGIWGF